MLKCNMTTDFKIRIMVLAPSSKKKKKNYNTYV